MAVAAHGVQKVVAVVVGQIPDQRRLESHKGGALQLQFRFCPSHDPREPGRLDSVPAYQLLDNAAFCIEKDVPNPVRRVSPAKRRPSAATALRHRRT